MVIEREQTLPGSASGRAFSPTQGFRFYSSRLAMRAVRLEHIAHCCYLLASLILMSIAARSA